jgi:hypothetical protein
MRDMERRRIEKESLDKTLMAAKVGGTFSVPLVNPLCEEHTILRHPIAFRGNGCQRSGA